MAAAMVAHHGADCLGHVVEVAQKCVHAQVAEGGLFLERGIEIGDIGLMMFGMMNLHGAGIDEGFQCVICIG